MENIIKEIEDRIKYYRLCTSGKGFADRIQGLEEALQILKEFQTDGSVHKETT